MRLDPILSELSGRDAMPWCRKCIARQACSSTAFLTCSTWNWKAKEYERAKFIRFTYHGRILHQQL